VILTFLHPFRHSEKDVGLSFPLSVKRHLRRHFPFLTSTLFPWCPPSLFSDRRLFLRAGGLAFFFDGASLLPGDWTLISKGSVVSPSLDYTLLVSTVFF